MKFITTVILGLFITSNVFSETVNFDGAKTGELPAGWIAGVTEGGFLSRLTHSSSAKWVIEKDNSAPSKPWVLKQLGKGAYPWCVKKDVSHKDGYVQVKFKPISGSEDQAGGLVWRWKDGNNYYVARANALENNISLYYTQKGKRHTLKYVDAPVAKNQWHTLRVTFEGKNITVSLNGKKYIELSDEHISEAGAVGVWTKADSVTSFDDFSYGGLE